MTKLKELNTAVFFGEQLRARRQELNLTQKYVAEKLGVHYNNVIEVEKGRRGLSADTLVKYCRVLRLEIKLVGID